MSAVAYLPSVQRLGLLICVLAVLAGCGGGGSGTDLGEGPSVAGFEFRDESAVDPGQPIDPAYTCDGNGFSPALSWQGAPDGTRELALVFEDPDAPGATFTHWIVYAMPSGATSIPEAVPGDGAVEGPTPLRQGENDFGEIGYGGPCPPGGETHRYVLRLLALDAELGLAQGADRATFDAAVEGHILAEARLEATYG
jgi:Raf kinase inhibitor-like YbhB/YbcL family protein